MSSRNLLSTSALTLFTMADKNRLQCPDSEVRKHFPRALTRASESKGHWQLYDSSAAFEPDAGSRICRTACANFGFAAPALQPEAVAREGCAMLMTAAGAQKRAHARRQEQDMATTDRLFAGSIPQTYDHFLVPLIFEGYASDLAERLARLEPRDVLETAAGTGVLTRAIASRLPAPTRIVATDLNQPMLDHAAARLPQADRITWRQADALSLPFGDHGFDAAVCQFGVMFFPDRVAGYREARRVVKPGGRFLFNVWDDIARNEFADVVTKTLATLFPDNPPDFMARVPHGYHDTDTIRQELTAAGFGSISVEPLDGASRASSPHDAAMAFCQGTPLRNEIEARDKSRLEEVTQKSADALARRFGNGAIEGRMRALVITAIA
jgi:ubiquinone/menaquinone biosynthesis C-methylase UbiE